MEKSNMIPDKPGKNGEFVNGFICMYSGDPKDLPAGWHVCDGQDLGYFKTPDLRSFFIVGADDAKKLNTHGKASKISIDNKGGDHTHSIPLLSSKAAINLNAGSTALPNNYTTSGEGKHSHNINIVNELDTKDTPELTPKWYALYYIIFVSNK